MQEIEKIQNNNVNASHKITLALEHLIRGDRIAEVKPEAMNKAGDSEFTMWSENSDGMQELAEGTLVMPLVKAVQELSQQVKDLILTSIIMS